MSNKVKWGILIFFGVLILFISYNGLKYSGDDFWKINISNILTLSIAIYLSFFMTQKNYSESRQKARFEKITDKINLIILDMKLISIAGNEEKNRYMMNLRAIDNRIRLLKKFNGKISYRNIDSKTDNQLCMDLEYIESQYDELNLFIGNHIEDYQFLTNSKIDCDKYLENISQRIDAILVNYEI